VSGERASERLRALDEARRRNEVLDDSFVRREARQVIEDALPEIIAVVEAAEEIYEDFAKINPPDLLPLPIQKIGAAREVLASKLSGEGQG
jgi:hypothetical protein